MYNIENIVNNVIICMVIVDNIVVVISCVYKYQIAMKTTLN